MELFDQVISNIINFIKDESKQSMDLMKIQRYMYILQEIGFNGFFFNFRQGYFQPYSKTLTEYLERNRFIIETTYNKDFFIPEFKELLRDLINLLENPKNDDDIRTWQQSIVNTIFMYNNHQQDDIKNNNINQEVIEATENILQLKL